jgi:arylsulfatase A-like enzyme
VIFTSDNGFEQGEHRIRTGKGRAYEESIRVPLVACGPGIPRGARVGGVVLNLDLAPTVAELCGATPKLEFDGRSWLPLLRDPTAAWRKDFLIEGTPDHRFTALRTSDALLVEHDSDGDGDADEFELYDLKADPFELASLHANRAWAERLAKLRERLAKLRDCRGASCW